MSYLKILKAHRKSEKAPTLTKADFSSEQKTRAAQGICIKCGQEKAAKSSYICTSCQDEDTMEDIQKDIEALRSRILGNERK